MEKLNSFYLYGIHFIISVLVSLALFGEKLIENISTAFTNDISNKNLAQFVQYLLDTKSILLILFVILEIFLRKIVWKFVYPELNYSGEWIGITRYEKLELSDKKISCDIPFDQLHKASIVQNIFSIYIKNTPSSSFNWRSISANLQDNKFSYIYHVNYTGNNKCLQGEAFGYEEMGPFMDVSGKPIVLRGEFYHCVGKTGTKYSGVVYFIRRAYSDIVKKNDNYETLPEWVKKYSNDFI